MRIAIIYYPMLEKIVITCDPHEPFIAFSPDDLVKLIRIEDVDQETVTSIYVHWKYIHLHGDFYAATPNLLQWIEESDLSKFPTFDAPIKTAETPILIRECQRHPLIRKSASALRNYISKGVENKKNGSIVRLEYIDLPEGKAITYEGYCRFIQRLNESDGAD